MIDEKKAAPFDDLLRCEDDKQWIIEGLQARLKAAISRAVLPQEWNLGPFRKLAS